MVTNLPPDVLAKIQVGSVYPPDNLYKPIATFDGKEDPYCKLVYQWKKGQWKASTSERVESKGIITFVTREIKLGEKIKITKISKTKTEQLILRAEIVK